MQQQIQGLLESIKEDYKRWSTSNGTRELSDFHKRQLADWDKNMTVKEGKKYIKVIRERGVWGFIVKEDGPKFRKGDILKAAGWNAPALNAPRGNIIDGGYTVRWTGPLYLN
tara:strand:- start:330 stop:665 length:336 start_codon:yes stop_codon:yes gene_type:complete